MERREGTATATAEDGGSQGWARSPGQADQASPGGAESRRRVDPAPRPSASDPRAGQLEWWSGIQQQQQQQSHPMPAPTTSFPAATAGGPITALPAARVAWGTLKPCGLTPGQGGTLANPLPVFQLPPHPAAYHQPPSPVSPVGVAPPLTICLPPPSTPMFRLPAATVPPLALPLTPTSPTLKGQPPAPSKTVGRAVVGIGASRVHAPRIHSDPSF
jgi:hypothetical protein